MGKPIHVFRAVCQATPLAHGKIALKLECGHSKVIQAAESVGNASDIYRAECSACNEKAEARLKWPAFDRYEYLALWLTLWSIVSCGLLSLLQGILHAPDTFGIRLAFLGLGCFTVALMKVYGPRRNS